MKKFTLVFLFAAAFGCSRINKSNLDGGTKDFLVDFQNRLNGPDEEILKLFATSQNKDEILRFVSILQNKDTVVKTRALFDDAKLYLEESSISLDIPTDIQGKGHLDERTFFTLYLNRLGGRFVISKIDGERLFREFFTLKSNIENEEQIAQVKAELMPFYERARQLQKDYDSVIWFVNHGKNTYYYVVNGKYDSTGIYKMGLVDQAGTMIVPVEFELIGNPSMVLKETIEVTRDGKIGYYNLEGKQIISPQYDWLIPYEDDGAIALTSKDSVNGWLDREYVFHEDFPSEKAKKSVTELAYLTDNKFILGNGKQDLIHVIQPVTELSIHYGAGLMIPSAYLVKNGIFSQIQGNFISTNVNGLYQYGTDYIENTNNKPFSVSETLSAFISDFKSRYIGGRGEFYTTHKIVLIDTSHHIVDAISTHGDLNFEFKRVTEQLFEAKFQYESHEPDEILEQNFPGFTYFKFDGHKLTQLESNRRFNFTEFVKIDSSYFSGAFITFDYGHYTPEMKEGQSKFASAETLQFIRDEILASNGYLFKDQKRSDRFKYWKWYQPKTETYEEIYSNASEIDKHNLDFIEKLIGPLLDGASS